MSNRLAYKICLCLLAAWIFSSCASVHEQEIIEPEKRTTLTVTRAGEEVMLQWASRTDESYTVMYSDRQTLDPTWKIIDGCKDIPGTGNPIGLRDFVPLGEKRYYHLVIRDGK